MSDGIRIAMLGRFLSSFPSASVESATLRADAFTTHEMDYQDEFYCAIDELEGASHAGSAFLGTTLSSSGCMYKCFAVDLEVVLENAGKSVPKEDLKWLIVFFIKSMILGLPDGKKHSKFAYTYPVYTSIIPMINPVSFANAFEKKVENNGEGYVSPSIAALKKHYNFNAKYEPNIINDKIEFEPEDPDSQTFNDFITKDLYKKINDIIM
jgi:CRISPR system Cascade subunit CasC